MTNPEETPLTSVAVDVGEKGRVGLATQSSMDVASAAKATHAAQQKSNTIEMKNYHTVNANTYASAFQRPHLDQLLYGRSAMAEEGDRKPEAMTGDSLRRFGIWDGVFARCLLNIFGVIMFLRLGYIMGKTGLVWGMVLIVTCCGLTLITTLSLSAICTNGDVGAGGAYFMISRALGPQIGGSIGILFGLGNAVGIALYLVGFAETVVGMAQDLESDFTLIGGGEWDLRIYAIVSCILILILCLNGVDWVIKVQLGLLGLLVLSILSVIVGMFTRPTGSGFHGPSESVFSDNVDAPDDFDVGVFFEMLGIFFPAVTGIMAGANISGEISDPHRAIPFGTIYAVVVSCGVYMLLGCVLVWSVDRFTLIDDLLIMTRVSLWSPLIYAGIYAATISSAIASLVGAPRILQAVARDNLFPKLAFFGVGHGPNDEPWNGYIFSFIVAIGCILIGDLNLIAPLITGFFMISYALINMACFIASYSESPGWRPSFKYYHPILAAIGFIGCLLFMFLMNWYYALATLFLGAVLYKYLDVKQPDVNWGSAIEAQKYQAALSKMNALARTKEHVKTYRPQVLVLSGQPSERLGLVQFSVMLEKAKGMLLFGNVRVSDVKDRLNPKTQQELRSFMVERQQVPEEVSKISAFYELLMADSLDSGARSLMQLSGLDKLRPNIVLMGYKHSWNQRGKDETEQTALNDDVKTYVDIMRDALFYGMGLMVLRNHMKLADPHGQYNGTIDVWWLQDDGGLSVLIPHLLSIHRQWENATLRIMSVTVNSEMDAQMLGMTKVMKSMRIRATAVPVDLATDEFGNVDVKESTYAKFHSLHPTLAHAGGPDAVHEAEMKKQGAAAKAEEQAKREAKKEEMDKAQGGDLKRQRPSLMSLFGTDSLLNGPDESEHVVAAPDKEAAAKTRGGRKRASTLNESIAIGFDAKAVMEKTGPIEEETEKNSADAEDKGFEISERCRKNLRIAELVKEHSHDASLVVISMPIPDVHCSELEYMAWLEMMSNDDQPPTLFIRGNNKTVVTFEM